MISKTSIVVYKFQVNFCLSNAIFALIVDKKYISKIISVLVSANKKVF